MWKYLLRHQWVLKYTFKNIKTSEGFLLSNFIFNVLHLKSSFRENRKPLELIRHTYTLTEQAQYWNMINTFKHPNTWRRHTNWHVNKLVKDTQQPMLGHVHKLNRLKALLLGFTEIKAQHTTCDILQWK